MVERPGSLHQFLHDRIFVPLAMANTVAHESGKNQVANRAYGHTRTSAGAHTRAHSAVPERGITFPTTCRPRLTSINFKCSRKAALPWKFRQERQTTKDSRVWFRLVFRSL